MAYAGNSKLSGLAGLIGAGIGAYCGYMAGVDQEGLTPIQGALIMGAVGLVVGSAGAFILKNAMQFVIYAVIIGALAFFFRDQIEMVTGVDPVVALNDGLERLGITLPGFVRDTTPR